MRKFRAWMVRFGGLFNKGRKDGELQEELEAHIQMHTEDNLQSGMAPEEARRQAMIKMGGIESTKEACRDQRGLPLVETLWQDIHFAGRQLRKTPGFTVVAVLTLALGIGANCVVFGVAKAVLLHPLGFAEADRLMWIRLANAQTGTAEDRLSWRDFEDVRASVHSFESVALFGSPGATWEHENRIEELRALRVTPNLGDVLRLRAVLGRMFLPSDAEESAAPVVLISYELWQTRFGGRPDIIGQTLRLNESFHTIVGVLPPGLQFPLERALSLATGRGGITAGDQAFWFPLRVSGEDRESRSARMFLALGRLKPGLPENLARTELAGLGRRLAADQPETNRHWTFDLLSLRDQVLGRTRQGIPLLAAAVAAMLLICCVNLGNLLLARGVTRQRELAVRLALGAGRWRLVQTLMMENVLLSLLGSGLAILLATGAIRAIRELSSGNVPFIHEATVDGTVVAFTAGLSLLTALAFGLLPALRQSRDEAAESLRSGAHATGGRQIRAWHRGLLVGQIALVLVLLNSAGMLLESFRRLMGQDLGYKPKSVIALDTSTPGFANNQEVCRVYRTLRSRLAVLPGVEAVGTISSAPLTGKWVFNEKAQVLGQPVSESDRPSLSGSFVAFDYFQAMGIPLLDGRFFRDADLKDDGTGQTVILNGAAAMLLFPGQSAVGGRFTVGSNPDRVLEVVGVVKDTRDVTLEEKPQPRFYWQYAFSGAQVVVRSSISARAMMPLLRDAIQHTDLRINVDSMRPMTEIVSATVAERRFLMVMLTTCAAAALGIAMVGIFGVVGYEVAQRTNEFGVRLALGVSQRSLLHLVLMQTGRLVVAGVVIGLVLWLATNRLLASQLYGLSSYDPVLLTSVSVLLLLVALLASFLPARRAANVDPMVALRHE